MLHRWISADTIDPIPRLKFATSTDFAAWQPANRPHGKKTSLPTSHVADSPLQVTRSSRPGRTQVLQVCLSHVDEEQLPSLATLVLTRGFRQQHSSQFGVAAKRRRLSLSPFSRKSRATSRLRIMGTSSEPLFVSTHLTSTMKMPFRQLGASCVSSPEWLGHLSILLAQKQSFCELHGHSRQQLWSTGVCSWCPRIFSDLASPRHHMKQRCGAETQGNLVRPLNLQIELPLTARVQDISKTLIFVVVDMHSLGRATNAWGFSGEEDCSSRPRQVQRQADVSFWQLTHFLRTFVQNATLSTFLIIALATSDDTQSHAETADKHAMNGLPRTPFL